MEKLNKTLTSAISSKVFTDKTSPLFKKASIQQSDSPLAVVLGSNASGKSLLRRRIQIACNDSDLEMLDVSMEQRSNDDWEVKSEYHGSEASLSTGLISTTAVTRLLTHSREASADHLLFLDEPDVGLSDEVAAGLGLELVAFLKNPPPRFQGMVIVTHRRSLVMILTGASPSLVSLGDEVSGFESWLSRPIYPVSPREVITKGVNLYSDLNEWFESNPDEQ